MAKVGNEFGSTTGRARRCGWIDLVALKYSIEINGVTQLMMMKGDVLSGFEKIKVCTSYKINNSDNINYYPYDIGSKDLKPVYKELDGWSEDLTKITDEKDFPKSFRNYLNFLENELQIPIKIVSVGPDRKQTIFIN